MRHTSLEFFSGCGFKINSILSAGGRAETIII